MGILGYIIVFTLIGSVVALIGGIVLLSSKKLAERMSHYLASFAAGTLLGAAFLDLLPEASELAGEEGKSGIFIWALLGLLFFFLAERFIHWFHHHHDHTSSELKREDKSVVPLVIFGDSVHNFIDGVVIAGTFLVSIPLGIVTTLAVAAHEIPQEIGDFGILLHHGLKKSRILWINLLSSLTALFGAVLTFMAGERLQAFLPILLSLSAGFFIYIAASDLIPEIHNEDKRQVALIETFLLLSGVLVVWLALFSLKSLGLSV